MALGGVALLVSPAHSLLGDAERLSTRLAEQLALWVLLSAVLAIVLLWEKQPLSSIGLRRFHWTSLAWGIALALSIMYVGVPIGMWSIDAAGLAGFETGIARLIALPIWFRSIAVVTAGVVEETLFRGFAVERLAGLTGSYWLAGLVSLTAFSLVHLPFWGPGPVLSFFITGGMATAFFIWKRDLLANVVAHTIVDAMGLVVVPLLSE